MKTILCALLLSLATGVFGASFPLPTPPSGSSIFALSATNASGSTTLARLAPVTEYLVYVAGTSGARTIVLGTSGAVQGHYFTIRFQFPNSYTGTVTVLNSVMGGATVEAVIADGTATDIQRSYVYDGTQWIIFTPTSSFSVGGGSANDIQIGQVNASGTAIVNHQFAPNSGGQFTTLPTFLTALGLGTGDTPAFMGLSLSGAFFKTVSSGANLALVEEGDSITAGTGGQTPWPTSLTTNFSWAANAASSHNVATGGATVATIAGRYSSSVFPYRPGGVRGPPTGGQTILFVLIGSNDLVASTSAASTYAALKSYWSTAKADGFSLAVGTIMPRVDFTAAMESQRITLNELIRSDPTLYVFLVDFASSFPTPLPASGNLYYYDGVHLNTYGGTLAADEVNRSLFQTTNTTYTAQAVESTNRYFSSLGTFLTVIAARDSTNRVFLSNDGRINATTLAGEANPFAAIVFSAAGADSQYGEFQFGLTKPVYLQDGTPTIGFNIYSNGSGNVFGYGSSSNYAGTHYVDPANGTHHFQSSTAAGNYGAGATLVDDATLDRSGNLVLTGSSITGGSTGLSLIASASAAQDVVLQPSTTGRVRVNSPATTGLVQMVRLTANWDGSGTNAPVIAFNASTVAEAVGGTYKAGIGFVRTAGNGRGAITFYNNTANDTTTFTASDEAMRIAPGTNDLLIGTTSDGAGATKLVVNGSASFTSITATGVSSFTNSTEATAAGAGSLLTSGGFYAAKAIISGSATASTSVSTGALIINNQFAVGGSTGQIHTNGSLNLDTAGGTVVIKSGTNALAGTVTLSAGTGTITSTAIDANTVIVFSEKTAGGTPGLYQPLAAVTSGSATVTSAATDTSTYNWVAFKVN